MPCQSLPVKLALGQVWPRRMFALWASEAGNSPSCQVREACPRGAQVGRTEGELAGVEEESSSGELCAKARGFLGKLLIASTAFPVCWGGL